MKDLTWRFVDTGCHDSATNMAIDESILLAHSKGLVPPTIRFYGWKPATLTIGFFQKAAKEIDLEKVKNYRLGFVRRLTGGRTVLHDHELTYSVILSEEYLPSSVTGAYRQISQGLLHGFHHLGLNAHFSVPQTQEDKHKLKNPRTSVCFDAPSWYELVVEGRKVAGSAQTRQKGVVLQHGSIPLSFDTERLFDVFRFSNERIRQRMKEQFSRKAVAINELRSEPATLEQVKEAFYDGFTKGFESTLHPKALTAEENEWANELVRTKYGLDEWNYRK